MCGVAVGARVRVRGVLFVGPVGSGHRAHRMPAPQIADAVRVAFAGCAITSHGASAETRI